jgi:8-hydroxy-5-deazaflavin:NADPH oxidoreductase
MKIGIIGAGNVGGTLGGRWAKNGHEVVFGVRDPKSAKVQALLGTIGKNARAASIREAAAAGSVVVLTTPWEATEEAITAAGNLKGKIVVDATNPLLLGADGLRKGLQVGHTRSAAEQVAGGAHGAKVVKCFNTTGAGNMANSQYPGGKIVMFLCGDDAAAKATVAGLAEELGFEAADAGPLTAARYLEPLAMLWIHLAYMQGWGPNFALRVVKR